MSLGEDEFEMWLAVGAEGQLPKEAGVRALQAVHDLEMSRKETAYRHKLRAWKALEQERSLELERARREATAVSKDNAALRKAIAEAREQLLGMMGQRDTLAAQRGALEAALTEAGVALDEAARREEVATQESARTVVRLKAELEVAKRAALDATSRTDAALASREQLLVELSAKDARLAELEHESELARAAVDELSRAVAYERAKRQELAERGASQGPAGSLVGVSAAGLPGNATRAPVDGARLGADGPGPAGAASMLSPQPQGTHRDASRDAGDEPATQQANVARAALESQAMRRESGGQASVESASNSRGGQALEDVSQREAAGATGGEAGEVAPSPVRGLGAALSGVSGAVRDSETFSQSQDRGVIDNSSGLEGSDSEARHLGPETTVMETAGLTVPSVAPRGPAEERMGRYTADAGCQTDPATAVSVGDAALAEAGLGSVASVGVQTSRVGGPPGDERESQGLPSAAVTQTAVALSGQEANPASVGVHAASGEPAAAEGGEREAEARAAASGRIGAAASPMREVGDTVAYPAAQGRACDPESTMPRGGGYVGRRPVGSLAPDYRELLRENVALESRVGALRAHLASSAAWLMDVAEQRYGRLVQRAALALWRAAAGRDRVASLALAAALEAEKGVGATALEPGAPRENDAGEDEGERETSGGKAGRLPSDDASKVVAVRQHLEGLLQVSQQRIASLEEQLRVASQQIASLEARLGQARTDAVLLDEGRRAEAESLRGQLRAARRTQLVWRVAWRWAQLVVCGSRQRYVAASQSGQAAADGAGASAGAAAQAAGSLEAGQPLATPPSAVSVHSQTEGRAITANASTSTEVPRQSRPAAAGPKRARSRGRLSSGAAAGPLAPPPAQASAVAATPPRPALPPQVLRGVTLAARAAQEASALRSSFVVWRLETKAHIAARQWGAVSREGEARVQEGQPAEESCAQGPAVAPPGPLQSVAAAVSKLASADIDDLRGRLHHEIIALKHVLEGYKDTFGPAHPSLGGPAPSATTKQPSRYAEWTRTPASLGQRLKRLDTLSHALESSAATVKRWLAVSRELSAMHLVPRSMEQAQDALERRVLLTASK